MSSKYTREVHDSMGTLNVPKDALYGAQTQRAIENFPISTLTMPREFIQALGYIKSGSAIANCELQLLDASLCSAIIQACEGVIQGQYDTQFPIDIFQTGSGTSSNMNANEVIAHLASQFSGKEIHANDHVNMSQSSNDVIPTAIHVSASIAIHKQLLPALEHLFQCLENKAQSYSRITKTGRTHLMDAMPLTLKQEMSGWAAQIKNTIERLSKHPLSTQKLAIGGTAVGTGINAHPEFGHRVVQFLSEKTGVLFTSNPNLFEALSCQDSAVALSGQLKVLAVSLMKISNDLRWMNSGPLSGLAEISLPVVQPGSSIMPGKVNPVIAEAVTMVCAQVIGNDTTITIAGQSGTFQLNVMLPVIAYNLLQSITCLSNASRVLADKAISGFTVNHKNIEASLSKNPILVTALNPIIGYELGAKIAKTAYSEGRALREVAEQLSDLSAEDLDRMLDPEKLTKGGLPK